MWHDCPFGKTVISYSRDNGQTYTLPAPVIDTVLDDRDGGIVAYGEKNVIVTSFNNSVEYQRKNCKVNGSGEYGQAYVEMIQPEDAAKFLGATFRISHDCGVTFGDIQKSPVTNPHGPVALKDGSLLWVGNDFTGTKSINQLKAYKMDADGNMTYVGEIEKILWNGQEAESCEPHTALLDDGTLLTHIRVEAKGLYTIYQTESTDEGKTWTTPHQILSDEGGAPAHIFKHSSGMLISTYADRRHEPVSIKAVFSKDNGKTWASDCVLFSNDARGDMGYCSTIELADGTLLSVFYAEPEDGAPAVIMQQKWNFEDNKDVL